MHFSSQIKCFNQKNLATLENLHMLPKLPLFPTLFLAATVYLMDLSASITKPWEFILEVTMNHIGSTVFKMSTVTLALVWFPFHGNSNVMGIILLQLISLNVSLKNYLMVNPDFHLSSTKS